VNLKKFSRVLMAAGLIATSGAAWWWAAFYGNLLEGSRRGLDDALSCLYSSDGICTLVQGLSQLGGRTPYSPGLFLAGCVLLLGGAVMRLSLK